MGDGFVPGSQQRVGAAEATARGTGAALDVRPTALDADELVERFADFFAGREVAFDDVPLDLDWATPFQLAVARRPARGPARRGRQLRRARRDRGLPGRRPRGRLVLRPQPLHARRPVPPRRRRERARRLRLGRNRHEAPPARARGRRAVTTSEDVREELARIAPERECDRLAELSALFHSAGSLHLRGKGEWGLHLDLSSAAAARRAFSLLRAQGIRSQIRTYRRRAFDRATRYQLHVEGTDDALRVLVAAGVLDRRHGPLERPPRRVVARACCRAAYLRGAFLGGGSLSIHGSPHLELRTASVELGDVPARARGRRRGRPRRRRARLARRRVRQELGGDRVAAGARRRLGDRARARGAGRPRRHARAGQPARERRPREPRPDEPRGAEPARRRSSASEPTARSTGFRTRSARRPSSGAATRPRRSGSSLRAPIRPRAGRRAPPAAPARGARGGRREQPLRRGSRAVPR